MDLDKMAIIIAVSALGILVILGVVLYLIKIKKINIPMKPKVDKTKKTKSQPKEETQKGEKEGNSRLDGARVSHRRTHSDRIAQEAALREIKNQEQEKLSRKLEFERKNKLQLVYSPCSGDIIALAQTIEDAKKVGLYNPGVIIAPYDDKICSPINGIVKGITEENHEVFLQSSNGLNVILKMDPSDCDSSSDYWNWNVTKGSEVRVGDLLFQVNKELLTNELQRFNISIILDNYKQGQLLLMKNVNYVSVGDKLITIKEELL